MAERPNFDPNDPRWICPDCGTVHTDLQEYLLDIANLEAQVRQHARTISRLKGEQDQSRRIDPLYPTAAEVLSHWKKVCHPGAREAAAGKRLELCLARLKGRYTAEQLMRACDGYALKPYMTSKGRSHEGQKDQWRADADLIFRDAKHVDEGLRIADRHDDLAQVLGNSEVPSEVGSTLAGSLSPLGASALKAARHGFAVFPCLPGLKRPATEHGLQDAKTDAASIIAYWSKRPDANIGVATGAVSGIFVLDVDEDEGVDGMGELFKLEDQYGDLPTTLSVKTPRGGSHLYFQHPGWAIRNTAGFPAPGLDIRGDGGYVLIPSSQGPAGGYVVDEPAAIAPAPAWLLDLLKNHQLRLDKAGGTTADHAARISAGATQGERNNHMASEVGWLFTLTPSWREVLALARGINALVRPPLDDKEVQQVVQSIGKAEARKLRAA